MPRCPFKHPSVCSKLLRHGDRGRAGCRGKEAGCTEYHQVKMCYASMNTRQCNNLKDCSNGYHLKGTVAATKEDKKEKEPHKEKKKEQEKEKEKVNDDNNMASFLGQILLQQQEMKTRQDQQWQQMMLFMSKMGGMDSRPSSPMQGVQGVQGMPGMLMPSMAQAVGGYRPVA